MQFSLQFHFLDGFFFTVLWSFTYYMYGNIISSNEFWRIRGVHHACVYSWLHAIMSHFIILRINVLDESKLEIIMSKLLKKNDNNLKHTMYATLYEKQMLCIFFLFWELCLELNDGLAYYCHFHMIQNFKPVCLHFCSQTNIWYIFLH